MEQLKPNPSSFCTSRLAFSSLEKHPALRDSAGLESAWQELMAGYEESMA